MYACMHVSMYMCNFICMNRFLSLLFCMYMHKETSFLQCMRFTSRLNGLQFHYIFQFSFSCIILLYPFHCYIYVYMFVIFILSLQFLSLRSRIGIIWMTAFVLALSLEAWFRILKNLITHITLVVMQPLYYNP